MKRYIGMFLAVLLIGLLSISAVAKSTEIVFWHSMQNPLDNKFMEEIVVQFNETHPTIHVKGVLVPGTETEITKLMTAVAAGTGPDVYYLDRFTVAQRARYGVLEPVEDYLVQVGVDIEALKSKFFDFAIKEATYNGKLYALPWDTDARVLYYNKKLFKEAGLDPNKPPRTISELDEYADKLTIMKGDQIQQAGFVPWSGQGWHYTWSWAFGGKFYDPESKKLIFADDPKIVKALEWEKTYASKYGMKNIDAFRAAYGIGGGAGGAAIGLAEPVNMFLVGKEAMLIQGNWFLSQIIQFAPEGFEYGMAPIPSPPDGEENSTWCGGWSLVIPKGSKHPKEAAEFLVYMTTIGEIKYAIDTTHFAASKESVEKLVEANPEQKMFADLLSTAHCRPVIPVGALLWDKLSEAWNFVLYGEKDVEQALRDAQNEVQTALDKALK
ncbi:hypothetical protein ES703_35524 [subsurface metagenome]